MGYDLSKVNNFLNNLSDEDTTTPEVIVSGPDTIKNILINETNKLTRLELVTNELLNYLTDPKAMRKLSYKEKQRLLTTITDIQNNSRDFIFKVAELSTKNTFLQEVLKLAEQKPKEIVQSTNGDTFISSLDEDTRNDLAELLREVVNDRVRNS